MQEKALEGLRQLVMEDLLNRIFDYASMRNKCLVDIQSQTESGRQKELNEELEQITSDLKSMIVKSCKYRAGKYYSLAKIQV